VAKRPAAAPAKRGLALRAVLAEAYERMGGIEALTQWARDNPEKFYALWAKLQTAGEAEKPVEVFHRIQRVIVRPERTDG